MKKWLFILGMSAILVIAGALAVRAQIVDTIDVEIPFGFTVQNKMFPAGKYSLVTLGTTRDVMALRDERGRTVTMFLTESDILTKEPEKTELVFDRIGDEYFLSRIFEEGNTIGVELPKPRAERDLEKTTAMVQVQSVEVLAQVASSSKK
ncbi:MAG TPA: hypothetical protein VKM94_04665 [Blastocatellia bacterium]|nr:hypothetical protein [Blastocatellia bacterium]